MTGPPSIPFNIPFNNRLHFGRSLPEDLDQGALFKGHWSERVRNFFLEHYGAVEVVLTASCTNALEMAALLLDLGPDDEVVIPAYTYVSTANAIRLRGARPVFCDSSPTSPDLDLDHLATLITPRTKALVAVHYAGASTDMDRLLEIARRHGIPVIEDAAHAIGATFNGRPLGSFGDLSTISFHETKNVSCGQGGVLLINSPRFVERAHVLRDCGTDRHAFTLGQVNRYNWVGTGSVFNLAEINCAYLHPQLMILDRITQERVARWERYAAALAPLRDQGLVELPQVDPRNRHNGHVFHIVLASREQRDRLQGYLKERGIQASFHYDGLHRSPYHLQHHPYRPLPQAERYGDRLLRLPLFYDLKPAEVERIAHEVTNFLTGPDAARSHAGGHQGTVHVDR